MTPNRPQRMTKAFQSLSLSLGYPAEGGWKWETLPYPVNPSAPGGAGTLHAKVHTLHPHDPIWITRP